MADTAAKELAPAVAKVVADWKSGTIQTLGPLVSTAAMNALSERLRDLDGQLAQVIDSPTSTAR